MVKRIIIAVGTLVAALAAAWLFISFAVHSRIAPLALLASLGLALGFLWGGRQRRRSRRESDAIRVEASVTHAEASGRPQPPADDQQVTGTPSPEPAPHPGEQVKLAQPTMMDPQSVVHALLISAAKVTDAIAAHLWLEDTATGTLRCVAAQGSPAPPRDPIPLQGTLLGKALLEGSAAFDTEVRISVGEEARTIWRYAAPVGTPDVRGVAAVDVASDDQPPVDALQHVVSAVRMALSGALALHLAENEHLQATRLMKAARALSRTLDPDDVVQHALDAAVRLSGAATGSVMLLEEDEQTLKVVRTQGLPEAVMGSEARIGEGIAGWVAITGQPVLVEDLPGRPSRGERHGVRSAVSVPIADEDGLLGVLNVGSRRYPAHFTKSHMGTLELLGRQTAVSLRNARAIKAAEEIYLSSLKALALALESKDPYAQGGTGRVVDIAMGIGRSMRLSREDLRALEVASILHDIGMTAAGGSIGSCARPLSTIERGLVKMHPVLAREILEQAPAMKKVIPIVYHHHERYDGTGYVDGISGEEIPLGARILALADAYVAMTSDRPYRKAMTPAEADAELESQAGKQFDPAVVRAFRDWGWAERERAEPRF